MANREHKLQFEQLCPTLRLVLVVSLCTALAGCAMLPVAAITLAAQGAQGLVVSSLGSLADMQDGSAKDRCMASTANGVSVTESLERTTPTDEGVVSVFELAFWRPEFAREGYPQVEQSRTPVEGSLALTDRSISFVPPPGTASVRIPYELVQEVENSRDAVTDAPRSMIIKSCYGRFDIVTFQHADDVASGVTSVTSAAAVQLRARVAAFRNAANK